MGQQVSRDHPAIMDLKDTWAHGEAKAMKELEEDRDHQASKELKDLQVRQNDVGTKVKQVQLVPLETKVIQVLVDFKVPLAWPQGTSRSLRFSWFPWKQR